MLALVSEHGAIDAFLSAVVDESPPHEACVSALGAQYEFVSGANEQPPLSPIGVFVARVVPRVQFKAVKVSIFRHPPYRPMHNFTVERDLRALRRSGRSPRSYNVSIDGSFAICF